MAGESFSGYGTVCRLLFSNSEILSELADLPSRNLILVYVKFIYKFSKFKEMFKKYLDLLDIK